MARVAPIFSLKPTLKQDGTTVVFTAEVEAVPKPTAAWFRGETKVEASDRAKARLEQVGKSSKYKVLLTITNASVDDSGVYKVEVKNSLGKKSATINLDLKGGEKQDAVNGVAGDKPVIVGTLSDITVNQGGKIEYVVKVTGTKPLTITWYRNETEKLKSSARMKITFSQATGDAKFLVMEADAEDDGPLKIEATDRKSVV